MDCTGDKVHFYVSNSNYSNDALTDEGLPDGSGLTFLVSLALARLSFSTSMEKRFAGSASLTRSASSSAWTR
jgi:hypothetical protein